MTYFFVFCRSSVDFTIRQYKTKTLSHDRQEVSLFHKDVIIIQYCINEPQQLIAMIRDWIFMQIHIFLQFT